MLVKTHLFSQHIDCPVMAFQIDEELIFASNAAKELLSLSQELLHMPIETVLLHWVVDMAAWRECNRHPNRRLTGTWIKESE